MNLRATSFFIVLMLDLFGTRYRESFFSVLPSYHIILGDALSKKRNLLWTKISRAIFFGCFGRKISEFPDKEQSFYKLFDLVIDHALSWCKLSNLFASPVKKWESLFLTIMDFSSLL